MPTPRRCFSEQRGPPLTAHKYVSVTDKEFFLLPILRLCSLQFPKEAFLPKFYWLPWVFVVTNEEIGLVAPLVTFIVAQNTQQKQFIGGGFHLGSQLCLSWWERHGFKNKVPHSSFCAVHLMGYPPVGWIFPPLLVQSRNSCIDLPRGLSPRQLEVLSSWQSVFAGTVTGYLLLCCADGGFRSLPCRSCLCSDLLGRVTLAPSLSSVISLDYSFMCKLLTETPNSELTGIHFDFSWPW